MAKVRPIKAIDAGTSARTALRRLIAAGVQGFSRQLARMMTSDDIEGPHKARVNLRRLRATLTAFKPIIDKALYHRHQDRLRDLSRMIGQLRDADVLAHDLGLPDLVAAAADLRIVTRAQLVRSRADRFARRLARRYAANSWHRPGKKSKTARKSAMPPLAVRALDDIWQHSLSHGTDLTLLPEEQRHDLRKSLKILRYMSDQFGPIWPGPSHDGFTAILGSLQDDLGCLNDLAVARSRGLPAPDDPQMLAHAQTLWTKLRACQTFWASKNPEP